MRSLSFTMSCAKNFSMNEGVVFPASERQNIKVGKMLLKEKKIYLTKDNDNGCILRIMHIVLKHQYVYCCTCAV